MPKNGLALAAARTSIRTFFGAPGGLQVYRERRIIGHAPARMCALVADVDRYAEFVPWCVSSRILSTKKMPDAHQTLLTAELAVGFQAFNESYVSKVTISDASAVRAEASNSSVFRTLVNEWRFLPVPASHATKSADPNQIDACLVDFYVGFEFRHALYAQVSALFMDQVASAMVSAFENRARIVYGKPSRTSVKLS